MLFLLFSKYTTRKQNTVFTLQRLFIYKIKMEENVNLYFKKQTRGFMVLDSNFRSCSIPRNEFAVYSNEIYKMGKSYCLRFDPILYNQGFHFFKQPAFIDSHYPWTENRNSNKLKFVEIQVEGMVHTQVGSSIYSAQKIQIIREIDLDELKRLCTGEFQNEKNETFHFLNGFLHNDQGPAIIRPDGTKFYYIKGKLNRLGGPAIEYNNKQDQHKNRYFHNGLQYHQYACKKTPCEFWASSGPSCYNSEQPCKWTLDGKHVYSSNERYYLPPLK
jgi:hypothetical protein